MKSTSVKRYFLLLVSTISLTGFSQINGSRGVHVGLTLPTGILNSLVNTGKGIGVNTNSAYFYQVRTRFSADISVYKPNNVGLITGAYDYNANDYILATLICKDFVSLDLGAGLDYKVLPNMFPALYCGPEMIVGLDYANLYYTATNYYSGGGFQRFVHGGVKLNVGLEKKIGKIDVFGEVSFAVMRSQNYDYNYDSYYTTNKRPYCKFTNQKISFGIRF